MRILLSLVFLGWFIPGFGQAHEPMSVGEVYESLRKLNTLGSALYVAAHPDDENTRLITYLQNERHVRTAYISLTRGDGGQNLIGTEKGPLLGIIRTQELLAARRIDGGEQFFTRANDFGYSKTAAETFNIWDREQVLADLVWVIRKFRPDVMITRFPPPKYDYPTHGHHEASAILAGEAFDLAGDPTAFPEQLEYVEPWQPKRLYWNTSTWFYRRTEQEFDPTGKLRLDVGGYNAMLGLSYGEIAGESRSQHKSQGFGASETKGSIDEWLEYVKGDQAEGDLFDGIELGWGRIEGGDATGELLQDALYNFDPKAPTGILPQLAAAKHEMQQLPRNELVEIKRQELDQLIVGIAGLFYELVAESPYGIPGDSLKVSLNLVNRTGVNARLKKVQWFSSVHPTTMDAVLPANKLMTFEHAVVLSPDLDYTNPYWLREPQKATGMYPVDNQTLIGKPENDPALVADAVLEIEGIEVALDVPVVFKEVDRVKGEVIDPFVISPPVTVEIGEGVVLTSDKPATVTVTVQAWQDNQEGIVRFEAPAGWGVVPPTAAYDLPKAGSELDLTFQVAPVREQDVPVQNGVLRAVATNGLRSFDRSRVVLNYEHIPKQVLFPPAEARLVNLDLKGNDKTVGYVMGAGDEVGEYLSQVGFKVQPITEANFAEADLTGLDAVLIGIRALNTEEWLVAKLPVLMNYVQEGGNVIVQYQTTWGLLTGDFGPYQLTLGRGRVTEEDAEMKPIRNTEPVLNQPNRLGPEDYEDWVQERGLYFAEEWDSQYRPVFQAHDEGEDNLEGMLLIGDYGKGAFIYTGISFFRQLPAGVPGAYRLLTNLINYAPAGN